MNLRACFVSAVLILSGVSAAARAEHYEIFLLAGQSNLDGRASVKDLTGELAIYRKPVPGILINFSAGGLHRPLKESDGFQPLQPGFSGTDSKPLPSTTFGPEVSFGPVVAAALPGKHVLLIKFSEGGTNLTSDWNPDEKGKLYENFIKFVQKSEASLKARGDTFEIRGMAWHQGEGDAGKPAGEYEKMLTDFIARNRADLKCKDLPFVIGEVYDNGKRNNIIEDQKAVASKVSFTAFAESTHLTTFDKGTHFDAPSQIELGKRMGREMVRLLAAAQPRDAK